MTAVERTKFRSRTCWRKFRSQLLEERKYMCELCGTKKKKGLQVHHLYPENYTDLTPTKFVILDSACHDLVERFSVKLRGSRSKDIPNLKIWLSLLFAFLPNDVQLLVQEKYKDFL